MKTKKASKAFYLAMSMILALNVFFISKSSASGNVALTGEVIHCVWCGEICPSGTYREICISDGDGNDCTCGLITRYCPPV